MYDAIVIGAGPIGSYIAWKLADLGHKVVVVERHYRVGDGVCCTGIVSTECFNKYDMSDVNVWFAGRSCNIYSPSDRLLRIEKDSIQAYVIDRPGLDCNLANKAQDKGVDYLLSTNVSDVLRVDHRIQAIIKHNDRLQSMDGKVVIISNGFGFSLCRRIGIGQVGDYVFGAQAEVEVNALNEVEVYLGSDVAPGFFAWLVPSSEGSALVGLLSRHKPALYIKRLLSKLVDQGKIKSAEVKINYGGIPLRPLPRTYGDRMVVVGDAAGQVKPTTGGGIYYGLIAADIAVNVIHQGLCEDDLSDTFLKRYEKEWKKALAKDLQVGYWARRLYENLNDNGIEKLIEFIRSSGIHQTLLQSPNFSFDWHRRSILEVAKKGDLYGSFWSNAKSLLPF